MNHGQELDNSDKSCEVNGSGQRSSVSTNLRIRCQTMLKLFVDAYDFANDLHRPLWDFALDFTALKSRGVSINDLRWLVWQDFIEHGRDMTRPGDAVRSVRPAGATRSATASLARKVPACFSIASTSVVLPWSTWAMMAMLRMVVLMGADFLFFADSGKYVTECCPGWEFRHGSGIKYVCCS